MSVTLKLGLIEQEHLQELYDTAGVPRDELPYSAELARVCRDFHDRTFKNASEAQVYGAVVKYVRSGRRVVGTKVKATPPPPERLEQARLLKAQRPTSAALEPYTPAFEHARDAFARNGGAALSQQEFWGVVRLACGTRSRPQAAAAPA